jgi:HNH endonuclease/NUMOD3 motif
MGRNKGSQTGVVVTVPATCQRCSSVFQVLGKHRQDGPRPARYCSPGCYHASRAGQRPPGFIAKPGGAPKGREPWNKEKHCPQLAGENNGMYGKTHTEEVRQLLSELTSARLSVLTLRVLAGSAPQVRRSDPEYQKLYNKGWRTIKAKALARDDRLCKVCGARRSRMDVHHVIPFAVNPVHQLDNLVTLCTRCHSHVHRGLVVLPSSQ